GTGTYSTASAPTGSVGSLNELALPCLEVLVHITSVPSLADSVPLPPLFDILKREMGGMAPVDTDTDDAVKDYVNAAREDSVTEFNGTDDLSRSLSDPDRQPVPKCEVTEQRARAAAGVVHNIATVRHEAVLAEPGLVSLLSTLAIMSSSVSVALVAIGALACLCPPNVYAQRTLSASLVLGTICDLAESADIGLTLSEQSPSSKMVLDQLEAAQRELDQLDDSGFTL
ncbi:hypothetical protein KIPB_012524, partial [Kipferlia bialata]